jgi:hypothetical protein
VQIAQFGFAAGGTWSIDLQVSNSQRKRFALAPATFLVCETADLRLLNDAASCDDRLRQTCAVANDISYAGSYSFNGSISVDDTAYFFIFQCASGVGAITYNIDLSMINPNGEQLSQDLIPVPYIYAGRHGNVVVSRLTRVACARARSIGPVVRRVIPWVVVSVALVWVAQVSNTHAARRRVGVQARVRARGSRVLEIIQSAGGDWNGELGHWRVLDWCDCFCQPIIVGIISAALTSWFLVSGV